MDEMINREKGRDLYTKISTTNKKILDRHCNSQVPQNAEIMEWIVCLLSGYGQSQSNIINIDSL